MKTVPSILDFTVIDFETSGLNFRSDQIIEACAVRVRNGQPTAIFNTLVQPTEDLRKTGLDPKVTEITGHTIEELENGITEEQLATILYGFVGSSTELIVAYNALFDMSFLESLYFKYPYTQNKALPHTERLQNPFLDPLTIARDRSPYPHKLGDMCAKMGIPLENAHSAYDDTLALVELVMAMIDEDREQGLTSNSERKPVGWYVNKAGYKRKYGEPEWLPDNPDVELYPQGAKPDVFHKKPERKVVPKYTAVVTNNRAKRKRIPDPVITLPKDMEDLPEVPEILLEQINVFTEQYKKGQMASMVLFSDEEFETAWRVLTEVRKIPEDVLHSEHDGDIIIEYYPTK